MLGPHHYIIHMKSDLAPLLYTSVEITMLDFFCVLSKCVIL